MHTLVRLSFGAAPPSRLAFVHYFPVDSEDLAKISFCQQALSDDDLFKSDVSLDADLLAAIEWHGQRSADEVCTQVEARIAQIELAAQELTTKGTVAAWLDKVDPSIKAVVQDVNGPMLQLLADTCSYHDRECISLFRCGAPLVAKFQRVSRCFIFDFGVFLRSVYYLEQATAHR